MLSYAWGATIGWTANSTGVAQIELDIGIDAFVKLVASGGPLVDLRRTVRATKG